MTIFKRLLPWVLIALGVGRLASQVGGASPLFDLLAALLVCAGAVLIGRWRSLAVALLLLGGLRLWLKVGGASGLLDVFAVVAVIAGVVFVLGLLLSLTLPRTIPIMMKELTVYLTTPWAWIVFTGMAFLSSIFFIAYLTTFKQVQDAARQYGWGQLPPDIQGFRNLTDGVVVNLWGTVLVVTLFVAPFLSMRLFAEERRQKTFELLMTAPVRPLEIVLGKYLGGVGIIACTLGVTIVYPLILSAFGSGESGSALEWSTVLLGYFGMLLWGATCMAIGMFISSLTESQMVAALISFAIALAWMLVKSIAPGADEPWRSVLNYVSFDSQLQNLLKGVLDLKPLIFFSSIISLLLLLTHRSVEAQRWT